MIDLWDIACDDGIAFYNEYRNEKGLKPYIWCCDWDRMTEGMSKRKLASMIEKEYFDENEQWMVYDENTGKYYTLCDKEALRSARSDKRFLRWLEESKYEFVICYWDGEWHEGKPYTNLNDAEIGFDCACEDRLGKYINLCERLVGHEQTLTIKHHETKEARK